MVQLRKVNSFASKFITVLPYLLRNATSIELPNYRNVLESRLEEAHRVKQLEPTGLNVVAPDVSELIVEQPLDHFPQASVDDESKSASVAGVVLKQRYFYSARYVIPTFLESELSHKKRNKKIRGKKHRIQNNSHTPIYAFLCCGGEGPALDPSVLVDSAHCTGDMLESARRLHEDGASVYLFALEHRYYGKSLPDIENPRNNENLVYLSSRQAVSDLSKFVMDMNIKHNLLDRNVKWFTFGGSYPGMISAYARLKHPNLIHASISNSAPLQPIVDFPKYNDHVGLAYQDRKVGGSVECFHVISKGHIQAVNMLHSGDIKKGRKKFAKKFNVCNGEEALEKKTYRDLLLGDGLIPFFVQGNDPSCVEDLCNIKKICTSLLEPSNEDNLQRLARVAKGMTTEKCLFSYLTEDTIGKVLSDPQAKRTGDDSWAWQTCTEFGFFQTCEVGTKCPYGQGFHNVSQDLETCEMEYGIDKDSVYANVKNTLDFYGGWDLKATRIMFVNGRIDPWSELSITGDRGNANLPTLWVEGASHHFWTHAVKFSDSPEVVSAREKIYEQIVEWATIDNDPMIELFST